MRIAYGSLDIRSIRFWSPSKMMIAISLLTLVTAGCGSKKSSEIPEEGAISSASSAGLKPITAKPGETVSLSGVGFTLSQTNVVKITTAGGTVVTAPVTVISDTAATFVMPAGAGLGLTSVVLESNGKQMAGAMSFVANLASNTLPIIIDDTSEICSTKQYIDKTGATKTGTKDCAAGSVADCAADGTLGCKTVAAFPPVAASLATAANIKSGVTLAGVIGTFAGSYSNCSSAGEQSCVVSGAYFAGAACAADGSSCFLPAYSVMSQPLKAINFNNIDITKMLNSLTLSGATGTVVLPTIANVYAGVTFGAASASTGTLTLPSAATVRSSAGTFGVGGTGVTASLADCSSDGATGCVTTTSYKSALMTSAIAGNILSGATIAGVAGSVTANVADCSTNGVIGCVTTTTYKSGDLTNLTAGNIKSGVTIAGTAGDYPSATYTLPSASGTADLENANFDAQVKAVTAFEYLNSAGARQTGAGDTDITAANIANGVSVFGLTGTLTGGGTPPNAWDVRVGTTINSVVGKLKVNCRNGATLSRFDQSEYPKSAVANSSTDVFTVTAHGWSNGQTVKIYSSTVPGTLSISTLYYVVGSTTDTFQLSLTSGGAFVNFNTNGSNVFVYKQGNGTTEIWDTIDDYQGYASATPTYTGWSSDNQCGGIEAAADDAYVWKDVTTTGDGVTASTCTATPLSCSFKDKISGQEWHKADATLTNWTTALSFCDSLTYNGKTDWRLPSQKELIEAANHGIISTGNSTNWITSANFLQNYWSASSSSSTISFANIVHLGTGGSGTSDFKAIVAYRVICVRP